MPNSIEDRTIHALGSMPGEAPMEKKTPEEYAEQVARIADNLIHRVGQLQDPRAHGFISLNLKTDFADMTRISTNVTTESGDGKMSREITLGRHGSPAHPEHRGYSLNESWGQSSSKDPKWDTGTLSAETSDRLGIIGKARPEERPNRPVKHAARMLSGFRSSVAKAEQRQRDAQK